MHVRCPHCRNPIELVDDGALEDIDCPSCGSSFNLAGPDSTSTYTPASKDSLGHFTLGEKLGLGAFGTVWKANDTELDRNVAIKIPRKGQLDAEESEKFLREARTAAQLNHSNIVSVHEVGKEDDTLYIVSDFVDGITLTDWLTGQQPTPREAAELCIIISEALHHAHEYGVIHRDLKPGNILLDRNNEPHLTDFGLAKREAGEITMTMDGQVLGTPAYMSPEQARGEGHRVDRRTDIYSMGVILFELLTGECPFRGNTRMLIHQLLTEDAPSPRKLNAAIPKDLETICLKCLEKDPDRRFETAEELKLELQRWLDGEAIQSRPISRLARGWRWCKRKPVVAGLSALLLISLTAGIAISSYYAVEAQNSKKETMEALKTESLARSEAEDARQDAVFQRRKSEEANRVLRQTLYLSDMPIAFDAKHKQQSSRVKTLLDRHVPNEEEEDFRTFEWNYLKNWLEMSGESVACPRNVRDLGVSPNNEMVAIALGNANYDLRSNQINQHIYSKLPSEIVVYDVILQNVLAQFEQSEFGFSAVDFSADSKRVAGASYDGTLTIWDIKAGKEVASWQADAKGLLAMRYSPDGKYLATAGMEGNLHIWETETWKLSQTLNGTSRASTCIDFSKDGSRLAWGDAHTYARVHEFPSGKAIFNVAQALMEKAVFSVQFLNDNKLAVGCHWGGEVKIHDYVNSKRTTVFPENSGAIVRDMAYHSDSNSLLVFEHEKSDYIADPDDGIKLTTLSENIRYAEFSPDQKFLVFSTDNTLKRVPVSAVSSLIHDVPRAHPTWATLHPSEPKILIAKGGTILLKQMETQKKIWSSSVPHATASAFSPDGSLVLIGGHQGVQLLDAASGNKIADFEAAGGIVEDVCFSPDGKWAAAASGTWFADPPAGVVIYNVDERAVHRKIDAEKRLMSVTFSADSKRVVYGGMDHSVKCEKVEDGEVVWRRGGVGWVHAIQRSPDGRRLFLATKGVKVLDSETGRVMQALIDHPGWVHQVAIHPNGKTIATVATEILTYGPPDNLQTEYKLNYKLWDWETQTVTGTLLQPRFTQEGHGIHPAILEFSHDGNFLVAAPRSRIICFDGTPLNNVETDQQTELTSE